MSATTDGTSARAGVMNANATAIARGRSLDILGSM
jgi:hypothetical protein